MENKIIAVDFDGTLCENRYPEIGKPNEKVINYLIKRQKEGDKLILWTCRCGYLLRAAVDWCKDHGITFDAINNNLRGTIEWAHGSDSRKVYADEYIDDKNVPVDACREKTDMELWAEKEILLASKYKCECEDEHGYIVERGYEGMTEYLETAMKMFRNIPEGYEPLDGGMELTRNILNQLMNGKPLTPIEDTKDVWVSVDIKNGSKIFQCRRMKSLFKEIKEDGSVIYNDETRYHAIWINHEYLGWFHEKVVDKVMNELYPITMPYMPSNIGYRVYVEIFKSDYKSESIDTIGIIYAITPDNKRKSINRYFSIKKRRYIEISQKEYVSRKRNHEYLERELDRTKKGNENV